METNKAERILITSALPYANGSIHIGHLVEYIQTDIIARFFKLLGKKAIYCCADDTHGTPIQINAENQGITPEELIKKYHKEHQEDFALYHIEFDSYYSTNSPENKKWADYIFNRLKEQGLIYTKEVEQTYCEHCKRFLPDRFVKGTCPKCDAKDQYGDVCEVCNSTYKPIDLIDPYCSLCGNPPIRKTSTHYFFKLSALSDDLREYITNNEHLQPEVKNYILNWIEQGLEDWDISRDGPYFGFKIPGEEDKYYYVWLDAPIGYISSTEHWCQQHNEHVEDWWKNPETRIIHFIGKDIIYFHLLFWPAMLMKSGFKVPDDVVVHGFLKVNHEKMSKSRGTFLTARELAQIIEPELLRFYYAANLSHSISDIDLDFEDFKKRINNELIATLFNFIYRTLSFTKKFFDGKILSVSAEEPLLKEAAATLEKIKDYYEHYELREVVKALLQLSSLGNKYFQEEEPWKLVKENPEQAQKVLSVCVNLVKYLAIALKPILPGYVAKIEQQLNVASLTFADAAPFGEHAIFDAQPLVQKIEAIVLPSQQNNQLEKQDKKEQAAELASSPKESTPFERLNLKVARVLEVNDHPKADKLYVLTIDLGTEQRQLVAGLKPYYPKEELQGKHLVIVSNLKPAVLRGEKSQGMLLAGDNGNGTVKILEARDAEPGEQVLVEGIDPSAIYQGEISIEEVLNAGLTCKDGFAYAQGKQLKTSKGPVTLAMKDEGMVR